MKLTIGHVMLLIANIAILMSLATLLINPSQVTGFSPIRGIPLIATLCASLLLLMLPFCQYFAIVLIERPDLHRREILRARAGVGGVIVLIAWWCLLYYLVFDAKFRMTMELGHAVVLIFFACTFILALSNLPVLGKKMDQFLDSAMLMLKCDVYRSAWKFIQFRRRNKD